MCHITKTKKMETFLIFSWFLLYVPFFVFCLEKQVYIVYFGEHNGDKTIDEIKETHHSYLFDVKQSHEDARASLLYSYKHSINGFAAVLSPIEASIFSAMDEVVSVIRSEPKSYSLHTTRSWEFLKLDESERHNYKHNEIDMRNGEDLLLKAKYGRNVIVGLLDSGVWPESKSFSEQEMGPIPKSWKGISQSGQLFNSSNCNKKLIGARYYIKGYENYYGPLNTTLDYRSPRDRDGHGTHTASTVAGQRVENAQSLGGFAKGTASGGAPLSHLAIYKVCWAIPGQSKASGNTCFTEDMLAAIDDAIGDGVHVLSISIGAAKPSELKNDGIAIGAFHAVKNDIVVACSAGNSGPNASTLSNPAPWIITVGASSVDRMFFAPVLLGNGMKIEGQTVTPYELKKNMYPLVYAGDIISPGVPSATIGQCLPGSVLPEKAKGNIVFCLRGQGTRVGKGMEVKRAGGVGYILGNSPPNGAEISVDAHVLPATAVTSDNAIKIMIYINSTKNPTANILRAKTVLNSKPSPYMASFTSRGPNVIDPNILKPDIAAPGMNILAAWSEGNSPTKLEDDHRVVKYNILSGTSMSCPHVAAVAALVKAVHPGWTSAAIRSALVTTAGQTNNMGMPITDANGNPATPFQYGSGNIQPAKAADPGLVYDASLTDYELYLCSLGVKELNPSFTCPIIPTSTNNLNYPTLAITKLNGTETVRRTVTNVGGSSKSVYYSTVKPPFGYSVKVSPSILIFKHVGEKKTFTIIVTARNGKMKKDGSDEYEFGWYAWNDGIHTVRSPIVVSM